MRSESAGDTDSELLKVVLLALAAVLVLLAGSVAAIAATIATWLLGGPWVLPTPSSWLSGLLHVLVHPAATALPVPWVVIEEHPAMYAVVLVAVAVTICTILTALGLVVWQQIGPTRAGHASRGDIRGELSLKAARATAEHTRPSMTAAQRRAAPLTEVGAPMHYGPCGLMCVSFDNPTGTLAPTRSGKSRRDLSHKVLGAPGALLCCSTKPDLLEMAGLFCARRPGCGPVLVFDTTGSVRWPGRVRWSPVQGCDTYAKALRRANILVEASAAKLRGVGGNDAVFRERAEKVLAAYLLAAALTGLGVDALLRWASSRSTEPADLLEQFPQHELTAATLREEMGMVADTADAVWMSVRRVLEPLLDPELRALCSPPPGTGFDARSFIEARGALFLVAGEHQASAAGPFLTALADYWIETAREMGPQQPGRRLDPPATAVLDELGNATSLPHLPGQLSDSAGRGVVVHWAAQSKAGLKAAYGEDGADLLIENTTLISLWGGSKDQKTLEWVSVLSGHRERHRYQTQSDGFFSNGRTSVGTETVPIYRPGDVRKLPQGQVLVVFRSMGVIRAKTRDVSQRSDWPLLLADQQAIRSGEIPIDHHGRLTMVAGQPSLPPAGLSDPPTTPFARVR